MKQALSLVKEDLDNHLDTINQNTVEIQNNYEYLAEIEAKLDKLTERVDSLCTQLEGSSPEKDISLTTREQEVFLVLYTSDDKLTSNQIARKIGLTEEMVHNYLFNLVSKEIPVNKIVEDGQMFFALDVSFKDIQARKNVLKINETVSKELLNENML